MAHHKRQRNNTIAGFFVLASILGFVAIVVTLSDLSSFQKHQEVEIWFAPDLGTPGLEPGALVTLAGVQIGSVEEVTLEFETTAEFGPHVKVIISIPEEYVVRQGTVAGLVVPVLGSGATLNLEGLGIGEPLGPNEHLIGIYAPSAFLRSAGIGPEQITQVQQVIANVEGISTDVSEITEFARTEVEVSGREIVERINKMVHQIADVVASVRTAWPAWETRITSIMTQSDEATAKAKLFLDDGREFVANANEGVTKVRQTITDVAPKITESAENVRALTARANTEWAEKITQALDSTQLKIDQLRALLEEVDTALTTGLPEVARILGNMRIASDNLKLAMIEIRNEPWRLLAAPSERALAETLLYDSIRTYANAVSDLDASIAALKALRERYGSEFDPERDSVKRILELLETNYQKFENAEQTLFDFVLENAGPSNSK